MIKGDRTDMFASKKRRFAALALFVVIMLTVLCSCGKAEGKTGNYTNGAAASENGSAIQNDDGFGSEVEM